MARFHSSEKRTCLAKVAGTAIERSHFAEVSAHALRITVCALPSARASVGQRVSHAQNGAATEDFQAAPAGFAPAACGKLCSVPGRDSRGTARLDAVAGCEACHLDCGAAPTVWEYHVGTLNGARPEPPYRDPADAAAIAALTVLALCGRQAKRQWARDSAPHDALELAWLALTW